MAVRVEWLDAARLALAEAVEYLFRRFGKKDELDLSGVLVVVPGGRAGRRLLELLVDEAARRQAMLAPPEVATLGGLPERLYTPKHPFASSLTQQLAWAKSLRETPVEQLRPLLPRPPEANDDAAWLDWGELLRAEHTELAADALDFAQVAPVVAQVGGPAESERWQVLSKIQTRYLAILDELELWDLQTARLVAVKHREFQTTRPVVLIGTVDLNRTQRAMLDQIADHVTVLIPSLPEWRERFDEHGCLKPDCWNGADLRIPLDDDQFTQVDGPESQAEEVVRRIAAWNGQYRADEITIGFADERLVPQVERQLRLCRLPARWGPGKSLARTPPLLLLEAIADWLERRAYPEWARLVRHPDVTEYLERQGSAGDLLQVIDEYYVEHLPQRLEPERVDPKSGEDKSGESEPRWLGDSSDRKNRNADLAKMHATVLAWLEPLAAAEQSLDVWAAPLLRVVQTLYDRELQLGNPEDAEVWQACQQLRTTLEEFEAVPASLRPTLTASAAIRLALDQMRRGTIPARADATAIELLGWLELPLDDAPGLIVTTFNDGHVPQAVNADPFLPNSVRTKLCLDDNARRFARDAYALSLLHASRPSLHLIVARRDANGDPLPPSRLLFATDVEAVARRAARLFEAPGLETAAASVPSVLTARRASSTFAPPPPELILEQLKSDVFAEPLRLSVSDFKSYLACPYRFLLRKAVRCEPITDDAREMDGGQFGSLAHDVLSAFGKSPLKDSRDAAAIREFLEKHLYSRLYGQFGPQPRPAVLVQAEQLRLRLDAFADAQAARAAAGWTIEYVEDTRKQQEVKLDVDGKPFLLIGRIDRVDVHGPTGRHGVFDYKTGDRGDGPNATHRTREGTWLDLQLPLYRHLVRALGVTDRVSMGYIVLPKDVGKVGVVEAEWDEAILESADETAWEVVRGIRDRKFNPSPDFQSGPYDDMARICLANVLS